MKKLFSIMAILFASLLVTGCFGEKVVSKEFSANGFTITLTEDFYEKELISFTNYYASTGAIVTALKEEFTTLELVGIDSKSSLEDYAKAVEANNNGNYELKMNEKSNYLSFTYNATISGKEYYYYAVVKKGSDSFWLINFACFDDEKDQYQPKFEEWASTIKVD